MWRIRCRMLRYAVDSWIRRLPGSGRARLLMPPPCRRLEHVAQSVGIEPPITAGCDGERGLAPILGGLQRSIGTSSNQEALRLRCLPPRGCPCHNARSRFTQREA
jgi:hypothetical protein